MCRLTAASLAPADWQQMLHSRARALLDSLESGKLDEAAWHLQQLADCREQGLYQQVGKLTRELHNAIVNFQLDGAPDEGDNQSKVEGASKRLGYAIELTEQAANRTMDLVEQSAPLSSDLSQRAARLGGDFQKLLSGQSRAEGFPALAAQITQFFNDCAEGGQVLSKNLSEILLAQGFQDLSGQLIKRVTGLIVGIERDLLQLMLTAAKVEHFVGEPGDAAARLQEDASHQQNLLALGDGPVVTDQAQSQDEVDELLLSLGF